jgi:putative transcriptional regulator
MSNTKYIVYAEYSIEFHQARPSTFGNTIPAKKYMDHMISFKIEEVLQQRGQSLYWLSRSTGVSYTTLWRLTKDRALGMNFATLEKLCIALQCQPGDLMELDKDKKEKKKARVTPARATRRTSSLL